MDKTHNKYRCLLIHLALALATLAAYWQVHNFDFSAYDDGTYVTHNENVQAGFTRDSIIWAFTTGHAANWHPLTWLSLMLDCQLFGLNPGWLHLTNVLLHIANTLLLFAVLKLMTGSVWRSTFVAATFALHPLHVESVAWITERKDVLSTLFWILTMGAYLRYVKRPCISRYLLALLTFALGLMAKPMLVTLPFVLLLLDYWPLDRLQKSSIIKDTDQQTQKFIIPPFQWRVVYRLIREKVPFLILSVASSAVTFFVQQNAGAVSPLEHLPLCMRIPNVFLSYVKYIGKMIWPSRLAIFYPFPGSGVPVWQAMIAALFLVSISILVILLARRHKYLLVGWLWYLGTLVPVIGLVQVGGQAMADRYTYVPLMGLFIIIAWGVPDLLTKWRHRKMAFFILALVVILVLSICTHFQVRHWRDGVTNYKRVIAVWPDGVALDTKAKVHTNLGLAFSTLGKFEQALMHHKEALNISPDSEKSLNSVAWILATAPDAKLRSPEDAIDYAQQACMLTDYKDALLLDTLAAAYAAAGKFLDAVTTAEEAVQLATDDESKQEFQERLNLFKAGKPYIQPASEISSD